MVLNNRWKVEGGVSAIWTDPSDTAPFDTPLDNLSRVKFHSDLDYIQIIDEQTFSLSLPSRTGQPVFTQSYTLFAHGKAGYPFVLGKITVGGEDVAFTGSVPVQLGTDYMSRTGWFGRWLALGADDTNVYVYEYCVLYYSNSSFNMTYDAVTLPITVWVTDEILE